MNPQSVQAHCSADTSLLSLDDQRKLMYAALNAGLHGAVDVAKRDATGILKVELRQVLEQRIRESERGLSEDELGSMPASREEKMLISLNR